MINVSRFTDVQNKLKHKIKDIVKSIKEKIVTYSGLDSSLRKEGLKEIRYMIRAIGIKCPEPDQDEVQYGQAVKQRRLNEAQAKEKIVTTDDTNIDVDEAS